MLIIGVGQCPGAAAANMPRAVTMKNRVEGYLVPGVTDQGGGRFIALRPSPPLSSPRDTTMAELRGEP